VGSDGPASVRSSFRFAALGMVRLWAMGLGRSSESIACRFHVETRDAKPTLGRAGLLGVLSPMSAKSASQGAPNGTMIIVGEIAPWRPCVTRKTSVTERGDELEGLAIELVKGIRSGQKLSIGQSTRR